MQNLTLKFIILPPYEREICHYQKANIENIRKAIDHFHEAMRITNIDVNEKVNLVEQSYPHETIACDDRDPP